VTKTPAYTCDHCAAPVGLHDARCPSCGKLFDAVRCPRCGHQGPPRTFVSGCPSCRYLAPRPGPAPRRPRRRSLFVPAMSVLLALLSVAVVLSWLLRAP